MMLDAVQSHARGGRPNPTAIIIGTDPVKFATSFVHLYPEVSKTGDLLTEVNRRLRLVTGVMRNL